MNLFSAIRVAFGALTINKSRSLLTSLGIVIGVSGVIAMTSAGGGARRQFDERLESVGKNLILVRPGARTQSGTVSDFAPVTMDDEKAIRRGAGPLLLGVAPSQVTTRLVTANTHQWQTVVVGSTSEFQRVCSWTVRAGRFFDEDDTQKDATVGVLGQTVAHKLFPGKANPVGEVVRVDNLHLRVIGVLAEKGRNPVGVDQDDQVFVPITTLQHKLVGKENLAMILASARSEEVMRPAKEAIARVMREQHRLKEGKPDDFDVSSVQEMAAIAQLVGASMQALVAVIASISLIVGGIGIMNIMLTSVTERTREIGIRMAVGATPGAVLLQFLIEAVVLALTGGLLGITVGIAGALALARLLDWPVVVSPALVLVSFLLSGGVGIFFGYYPAWKASRLDPIQALRYE
jgi:putative ABC transport system permease protein